MPSPPSRLTRYTDPLLGELEWREEDTSWVTRLPLLGRSVRVALDTDRTDPTPEEQLATIVASHTVFRALPGAEEALRCQTAGQLAKWLEAATADQVAAALELEAVSVHGCGELHYRCERFLPGCVVTVYFGEDLSFGAVEVYER